LGNGLARNSLEAFDFVFASKDFSERNKHYLLSNSLINIKLDFPKSTYNNRLHQFNSLYTKNILKPDNESKFLKSIYKKTANVSLEDSKNNHKTLQEVINNNKGKVIYIDFWASWCAPCRQAFPAYEALKKDYKNKEIIFIFISGDDAVNTFD
jgi:thiol-disulfide isomerase/thioredoxin